MPSKRNDRADRGRRAARPSTNQPPRGRCRASSACGNIAAVSDGAGHVLLLRPDSVLVDVPKGDARNRLSAALPKLIPGARAEFADDDLGIVTLRVQPQPSVAGRTYRRRARRAAQGDRRRRGHAGNTAQGRVRAEYNHVVIGAQSVTGSPLGVTASWAGDMAFVGTITDETIDGEPVILSTAMPCPPPAGNLRQPLNIPGKTPPRVLVLDTGLRTEMLPGPTKRSRMIRRAEHEQLRACRTRPGAQWLLSDEPGLVDDEDETNDDGRSILDFEAGHGTFIAGIIRQICPDAIVHSAGVLSSFGDGDVYGVIRAFERVLAEIGDVDIVVMSFGTNLVGDRPGLFGRELTRLLGDAIGIAAAGNQSTCRPYFPAALPDVIGVGGLAADGKAWFTNFGGWVDACASRRRGEHVLHELRRDPPHPGSAHGCGHPDRHPPVSRVGALERHQLRRTQGRRAHRPGDVPQRPPGRNWPRRVGADDVLQALPLPGPRHRVQRLTARVDLLPSEC